MAEQGTAPYPFFAAVTTSDTVNLPFGLSDALYVGGAGALVAIRQDNTAVTFAAVPAGTTIPIQVKRVNATGTAATSIVAFYYTDASPSVTVPVALP